MGATINTDGSVSIRDKHGNEVLYKDGELTIVSGDIGRVEAKPKQEPPEHGKYWR